MKLTDLTEFQKIFISLLGAMIFFGLIYGGTILSSNLLQNSFVVNTEGKMTVAGYIVLSMIFAIIVRIFLFIPVKVYNKNRRRIQFERFDNKLEKHVEKIKQDGWKFFTMDGCPWCTKQKRELDEYKKTGGIPKVEIITCGVDNQDPRCNNVEGFPHWENGDRKEVGYQSLENLKKMDVCN
jgi:hypothetical protein